MNKKIISDANLKIDPIDYWNRNANNYPYIINPPINLFGLGQELFLQQTPRERIGHFIHTLEILFNAIQETEDKSPLLQLLSKTNTWPLSFNSSDFFSDLDNKNNGLRAFKNTISATHYLLPTLVQHFVNGSFRSLLLINKEDLPEKMVILTANGTLERSSSIVPESQQHYKSRKPSPFIKGMPFANTISEREVFANDLKKIILPSMARLFPSIDHLNAKTKEFLFYNKLTHTYRESSLSAALSAEWLEMFLSTMKALSINADSAGNPKY